MGLIRTVAPIATPIAASEVGRWCKIPDDVMPSVTDDLTQLIGSAVDRCERVSGRALITQTWELTLDSFWDEQGQRDGRVYFDCRVGMWVVELRPSPLIYATTADMTITYVDTAGVTQTLAPTTAYQVDAKKEPGRVMPAYGTVWPISRPQTANAVTITFKAGYGAAGTAVPSEIKDRLKAYVCYCWENRGDKGGMKTDPVDEEYLDRLFLRFWNGGY